MPATRTLGSDCTRMGHSERPVSYPAIQHRLAVEHKCAIVVDIEMFE